ncbi:MAG TPA: MFS transporter [Nitrolancea sp.]|nr:MFS transporter [Nitrolancea sp.]
MIRASRAMPLGQRTPFFALLTASLISQTGSALTMIALPWFVLQTTGSAAKAGVTLAVDTLPIFMVGVFGGTLVDRVGFKRVSIVSDLGSGFFVAAIPFLYQMQLLAFPTLLALVFLGSLLYTPGSTARRSLLPDLAERGSIALERANSMSQAISRSALLLGPPLGGLLVVLVSTSKTLWFDAISYVISALIVASVVPAISHERTNGSGSYLEELRTGLRFLRQDRVLFWLVLTFSVGSLVAEPLYTIVLPVYAKQVYGSSIQLGLFYSALAGGSLLGRAAYGILGSRMRARPTIIFGFGTRVLCYGVLAALPIFPIAVAAIALESICFEPINPLVDVFLQRRTPPELRGRVFGLITAIAKGTLPIGTLIGGLLLSSVGLMDTMVIITGASLVHIIGIALIPAFHSMDARVPALAAD